MTSPIAPERAQALLGAAALRHVLVVGDAMLDKFIAGRVTRVFRRAGEAVRQGDPVIEVVSARRLRVEGYVSAKLAGGIHPGDRATVESSVDDEPPQRLPARIVFVDDSIEPNSRTVRIWAEVKNENGTLRAGQQASLILDGKRP